ncbi:MAG: aminopeptidase [Clostridia bacterium]|nr:aminopeptidase [Clostridia bacterium]
MDKTRLQKYAHLIAKCGVNVQKGQDVLITAELDQPEFVAMLVEECYKLGAAKVYVDWSYQPLVKYDVEYCEKERLGSLLDWQMKKWEYQRDTLPCKIYLMSEDPDGLAGVDQKKYSEALAARSRLIKPIRNAMENKYQWCIAAVPGKEWARKVFPEAAGDEEAVELLWSAILDTSRINDDPIEAWRMHNENLKKKYDYLNSLGITELHFKAGNGTDLRVGLIDGGIFLGGGEETLGGGVYYNPNIPSEEIFTSPMRGKAEGIVYSSKPLSYEGQLIDNFFMKFEGGKAVEVGAEKNEELLRELIAMDEGAAYLGECALVPYSSPIRESGLLFYNTLFDENAACHLALGRGFTNLIRDYEKHDEKWAHEMGINDSIVHEDFMIGTKDMSITATAKDGRTIAIFENGEWAF